MKKAKTILLIIIAILLIMTGYLLICPLQSESSKSINKRNCSETIEVQPGNTVSQTFQCQVDNLNKITFRSPYAPDGIPCHVIVKSGDKIWAEEDIICQNANCTTSIKFSPKKSLNQKITVEITNTYKDTISMPKEKDTKHKLGITYCGLADDYFFAWYPLFVAAILIMLFAVI